MTETRNNRPVFVGPGELRRRDEEVLGRPLTPQEERVMSKVDAIRIDSLACGRSVATTVENLEKYGGEVSDAVKAVLGLVPPTN